MLKKKVSGLPHIRSDAKFVDVADVLRKELLAGRWAPGEKLPTWTDLCKRFSLGRPTLTRALDILKEERFIVANSTRGTYAAEFPPHQHRYPLLFQGHPGLAGSDGWNLFWDALLRAARKGGLPGGDYIEPMLDADQHSDNVPSQLTLRNARRRSIAGVLIAPGSALYGFPEAKGIPNVYIGWDPKATNCRLTVSHDWGLFEKMAVKEVLSKGHRRIAVLAPSLDSMHRTGAEVRKQGGVCPDEWTFAISGTVCVESVGHLVHLLLSGPAGIRPDALIVLDDNLMPGVIEGIDASGVTGPDDLLVVAHCNDPADAVRRPGFRPLCFPVRKVLETAIGLAKTAQKEGSHFEKHIAIPPEFL